MANSQDRKFALVGVVAFVAVSWLAATAYVARNDWFGSGDLSAFAFWSCLLAIPAYPALRVFDRWSVNWTAALAYSAAVVLGLAAGALATVVVAAILGGWIGAFSFPVFLCWLAGTLSSFAAVVLLRRPATWAAVLPTVVLPLVGTYFALQIAFAQPPDLLLHVEPAATSEQIETIWSEVLGTPHPSGRGHSSIEGVQVVSRADSETEARIRVGFVPGTSEERRAEVVQRVLESPLVARVSDVEATPNTEFSAKWVTRHPSSPPPNKALNAHTE